MKSPATTPEEYIAGLESPWKEALDRLRQTVRAALRGPFEESMDYGMITYRVPLAVYPGGYRPSKGGPLPFLCLAAQKGYLGFYHLGMYADPGLVSWFTQAWEALGVGKLDLGKSCIRLRKPEKIPFELLGTLAGKMDLDTWVKVYEESLKPGS